MALRSRKPTSPGRRFQTVSDFAEITRDRPERSLSSPPRSRRPQQLRPQDLPPPRRRPQAGVPDHRLPPQQGRRAGQGRVDRVRPEPQRPHRAAPLSRRREALHPRSAGIKVGDLLQSARALRFEPATPFRFATSRSARSSTTSSCARWRRQDGPRGGHEHPARGQRRRLRHPAPALDRDAARAHRLPRHPRVVGNAEDELIKVGKAGRNRWKGIRPQTRGVAMNPVDTARWRRRQDLRWSAPGLPVGKPEGRTRDRNKDSNDMIVRRRRTRGSRR